MILTEFVALTRGERLMIEGKRREQAGRVLIAAVQEDRKANSQELEKVDTLLQRMHYKYPPSEEMSCCECRSHRFARRMVQRT